MAIVIEKETEYGIICSYFKIRSVVINNDKKLIAYNLCGYVSREARDENKNPICTKDEVITFEQAEYSTEDNAFEKVYNYLKTTEEFKEATDLI